MTKASIVRQTETVAGISLQVYTQGSQLMEQLHDETRQGLSQIIQPRIKKDRKMKERHVAKQQTTYRVKVKIIQLRFGAVGVYWDPWRPIKDVALTAGVTYKTCWRILKNYVAARG